MKRLLRISVVLAIAVLVLTFLRFPAASSPAHAAFPGVNGKIAFVSNRTGNYQIFSMNPDGSGQTNLSNTTATDFDPDWSPDATKIAFDSNRAGNDQIFVMNADGSGVTQLTNVSTNFEPDWSPDGTKIVFVSDRSQPGDCNSVGHCEIYTMNADGSNVTRVTFTSAPTLNATPKWSPDGTKIAFVQGTPFGPHDIWEMNSNGSSQTQLTSFGTSFNGIVFALDWSPDGTQIVFERSGGGAFGSIWVMNADGSNQTNLSNMPAFENDSPAWSPDGTKITFGSNRDAVPGQIYTMNSDGSGVTRLTFNTATDASPDWGRQQVISVTILVKPGDTQPAPVNPKSTGKIPVAILSTSTFDATTVDPTTVKFGATGTEASPTQFSLQDVNGDGLTDMLLQFNTQASGIVCGTTSVTLTGKTTGGQMISGTVPITTVGCG